MPPRPGLGLGRGDRRDREGSPDELIPEELTQWQGVGWIN